ncbi:MAG TPA: energy transducer TonB [Noviherbaspirillum sp.]|nr:energy transducer TonB [Noviherbaspirillum sp.]
MPKPAPIAATILLHTALIAAVMAELTAGPEPDTRPEPLKVQLLPPEPAPVAPPAPPAPIPSPARKEPPAPKPVAKPAPAPKPAPRTASPAPAPSQESAQEAKPAPPAASPPPLTAAPPAPVRTSASEASYAATNRTPPYPRISLSNGEEGTVVLRVLVTAEGTAGAVEVKASSGHTLLDESARKTVVTWRFKPATVDGRPVPEWYQVPIPFKLQNN